MSESKELLTLRAKTERYLKQLVPSFEVVGDRYRITYGSSALLIHPLTWRDNMTILRLVAVVLRKVKKAGNEAMFEEFSQLNDRLLFGKIYWIHDSPEVTTEGPVLIEHNFIGEYLDYEEFQHGCISLSLAADELDEQLKSRYGGLCWVDD